MGLFSSRSSSSNTNNNFDNRVVNDYQGANLSQSTDTSIDGNFNNNTGTVNMLDAGSLASMQSSLASSERVSINALDNVVNLSDRISGLMGGLSRDALTMADGVNSRTLSAALDFNDRSQAQVLAGNDLALSLARNSAMQQADTNQALTDGFEQSMQFVEQFSRSDGAELAKSNVKIVGVIVVAALVGVYIMKKG